MAFSAAAGCPVSLAERSRAAAVVAAVVRADEMNARETVLEDDMSRSYAARVPIFDSPPESLAKLLTRFGRQIAPLASLNISYPVGRSGARFEALLPTVALERVELGKLLRFVVQDEAGCCFPAMIEHVATSPALPGWSVIRGVLVAHG